MQEETSKESNLKTALGAVGDILKEVPVYQDLAQPSVKQIGGALATITQTVNIALAPIKALVWGYDQIENFVTTRVSEKLKNIPKENIITPQPQLAGPTVEALRYTGHDNNLRELFANLLATAMDKSTFQNAHPGYVEIIKNLSSDEALVLKAFIEKDSYPIINASFKILENKDSGSYPLLSKYSHLDKITSLTNSSLLPSYLDNLCRLGLLEIPPYVSYTNNNKYKEIEEDEFWNSIKEKAQKVGKEISFEQGIIRLTSYGELFIQHVVKEKA